MKKKYNLKNILAYLIGNFRYQLYYSKYFKFLIRKHILEQIDFRIEVMEIVCYKAGSCSLCGCTTTALQMANKSCEKPCYPPIVSKKKWRKLSNQEVVKSQGHNWLIDKRVRHVILRNQEYKMEITNIQKNGILVHTKIKS